MSELLDTHELSTNIGSNENNSFCANNQDLGLYDLNEELDTIVTKAKIRSSLQNNSNNRQNGKEYVKQQQQPEKIVSQRTNTNSLNSGSRYTKNYQVN